MSRAKRTVRWAFAAFVLLNAIAVTYPGIKLANRIQPFLFGLPFVFFWVALWIVLGLVMLVITDTIESQ